MDTTNSRPKCWPCQAAVPFQAAFMLACRLDLPARAEFAARCVPGSAVWRLPSIEMGLSCRAPDGGTSWDETSSIIRHLRDDPAGKRLLFIDLRSSSDNSRSSQGGEVHSSGRRCNRS